MNDFISVLERYRPTPVAKLDYSSGYVLTWRQHQLLVQSTPSEKQVVFPPLEYSDWLVNCLQRSPVSLVRLSTTLGETRLKLWADACLQTGKLAFLQVRSTAALPQKRHPFSWRLKRTADWIAAALILLLLSPLMVVLALLVRLSSPGPIFFYQWRVGARGKLFRIIKFRSMVVDAEQQHHKLMVNQTGLHKLKNDPRVTPLGRLMRQYSLDELPQLFNVLRGEMSLVGPRPWALYDAVRISPDLEHRLNALPGITGAWQVEARSNLLDLNSVNQVDLEYLQSWSLWKDLKFLLRTVPKVFSKFGAY